MDRAAQAMERLEALGLVSDDPHRLTRLFGSPSMRRANAVVRSWMEEAGMQTRTDATGNLIGHYRGARPGAKTLLLGSHLDTVRDAGRFDGALGVILAIASIARLHKQKSLFPFAMEVVAFADEEGTRFQTSYLGSRAVAGLFDPKDLARRDENGVTLEEAIREFGGDASKIASCKMRPEDLLGYVELHIEQGPVLESRNQALGIVSAIAGQTRARIEFLGRAGHAGTTPMELRQDALCAAAEFILAVERKASGCPNLVATVGQISAEPNVSNVICGRIQLTLDVRHQDDSTREIVVEELRQAAEDLSKRRGALAAWATVQETASVRTSPELSDLLRQAALLHQPEILDLPSGAGHDAAVMSRITPVAMLFARCKSGISHHPDESVEFADLAAALSTLDSFQELLAVRA